MLALTKVSGGCRSENSWYDAVASPLPNTSATVSPSVAGETFALMTTVRRTYEFANPCSSVKVVTPLVVDAAAMVAISLVSPPPTRSPLMAR